MRRGGLRRDRRYGDVDLQRLWGRVRLVEVIRPTGVTVTDDDEETIEISPTAIDITEGDGVVVTGTYNVSLSAAPTGGNVTVAIAVANNTDVTTNPTSLTFSANDWATAMMQTVTKSVEIRVADDDGADDETADITHTQGGADYGDGAALGWRDGDHHGL